MATLVLTDCKLWVGSVDLSGDMNALTLSVSPQLQDRTTFGSGGAREYQAGLIDSTFNHSGFWDSDGTDEPDDVLYPLVGGSSEVVTIGATDGTAGTVGYAIPGVIAQYAPGAAVGDMFAFSVSGSAVGDWARGTIMEDATSARNSAGNSSAYQLGDLSSGEKLRASLHVVTDTGGSNLAVNIQSDSVQGMTSPTTRASFTTTSAVGAEFITNTTATTDTWWRIQWTVGAGSFNFVVCVAVH